MKTIKNLLPITLLLFATWGLIWAFITGGISYFRYFTNQSVFLVWFSAILYYSKYRGNQFYNYLATISLVSIFISMSVFHILLDVPTMTLHFHLTHTIIPITYFAFYYFITPASLPIKKFWSTLIHPLLYAIIFMLYGTITDWFPYPFLNVNIHGINTVLLIIFVIMTPIYTLVSILLIFIKRKIS
ncbi:MAG: Pr6Pr family membrane protein [Candidatus Izemoplasmataceae bacterium]